MKLSNFATIALMSCAFIGCAHIPDSAGTTLGIVGRSSNPVSPKRNAGPSFVTDSRLANAKYVDQGEPYPATTVVIDNETVDFSKLTGSKISSMLGRIESDSGIYKTEYNGNASIIPLSVKYEKGVYQLKFNYWKRRPFINSSDNQALLCEVGMDIVIEAKIIGRTGKIGSFRGLDAELARNNVSGSIKVKVLGIDSRTLDAAIAEAQGPLSRESLAKCERLSSVLNTVMTDSYTTLTPYVVKVADIPSATNPKF